GRSFVALSWGANVHDIALMKGAPAGRGSMHHVAIALQGGPAELRAFASSLRDRNIEVEMALDHKVSQSVYILDPGQNPTGVLVAGGDQRRCLVRCSPTGEDPACIVEVAEVQPVHGRARLGHLDDRVGGILIASFDGEEEGPETLPACGRRAGAGPKSLHRGVEGGGRSRPVLVEQRADAVDRDPEERVEDLV